MRLHILPAFALAASHLFASAPVKPNVIIIVIDDLGDGDWVEEAKRSVGHDDGRPVDACDGKAPFNGSIEHLMVTTR